MKAMCVLLLFIMPCLLLAQPCIGKKVVILGSSTAVGTGASDYEHSWVGLFSSYMAGSTLVNLALGGYTTYQILPTGTNNGARPAVDPGHNITAAWLNLQMRSSLIYRRMMPLMDTHQRKRKPTSPLWLQSLRLFECRS